MESSPRTVLPIPRLRLSRTADAYEAPAAGPSRDRLPAISPALMEDSYTHDRDDDEQPTPKLISTVSLMDPAETPAARLRALLARTSAASETTPVPQRPSYSSDNESDFDPPGGVPQNTPSLASETLKDIFSRALRDPGNTPQKDKIRTRRNSFDVSEVEASPRIQREKVKNKLHRKSLSDEETGNPSKSYQRSEASFKSSQAITFDILRERLTNAGSQLNDMRFPDSLYEPSLPDDDNHDEAAFLRDLNPVTITPPAATSTPQQSLCISVNSHFPFQSNLMEQDSEMQRAIEGLDSYEVDGASHHPVSFPPPSTSNTEARKHPSPWSTETPSESSMSQSHRKSLPENERLHDSGIIQKGSEERRTASRTSSLISISGVRQAEDPDRRAEKQWNKPRTPARARTPELSHQPSHQRFPKSGSPVVGAAVTLSRRGSNASLRSFDDRSSKGSSFGSQAEYRERLAELERDRNIEREQEWNRPHPKLSRSSSSLSFHSPNRAERRRTWSLIQLDSTQALSPARTLQRHHSLTNSSRGSSPTGSVRGEYHGKAESGEEDVIHERERNWNAPRPKWTQHDGHRSRSPLQTQLPAGRHGMESAESFEAKRGESPVHGRHTQSVPLIFGGNRTRNSVSPPARVALPLPLGQRSASPLSNHHDKRKPRRTQSPVPSTRSPLPPASSIKGKGTELEQGNLSKSLPVSNSRESSLRTPASTSKTDLRAEYSFVRHRTPLPPINSDRETQESPSLSHGRVPLSPSPNGRSASRNPGSSKPSGIPISSPRKTRPTSRSHGLNDLAPQAINLEHLQAPPQATRLTLSVNIDHLQEVRSVPGDDPIKPGDVSQDRTFTMRTVRPPLLETSEYTPSRSPSPPLRQNTAANDESRLQKALSSAGTSVSPAAMNRTNDRASLQELSPPPSPLFQSTPHRSQSSPKSFFSTPPRRPSKLEFQTPSPPKNLPELPGPPPPSSEDEAGDEPVPTPITDLRSDLTAMNTPRPPGAWASTPAHEQRHTEPSYSPLAHLGDEQAMSVTTQTPAGEVCTNLISFKTPRPPGAWAATPAPPSPQQLPTQTRSLSGDTEEEWDSGLATPVTSLSRASAPPARTPGPPVARKSILKVRFDAQGGLPNGTIVTELSRDPSGNASNVCAQAEDAPFNTEGPIRPPRDGSLSWTHTLESSTPGTFTSRHFQSPSRRSPGIRILDAFGREVVQDAHQPGSSTKKSTSGIRIVDAMGREVGREVGSSDIETSRGGSAKAQSHDEAVVHIRQGLADLAEGLDAMDRSIADARVGHSRAQELRSASEVARAARSQLTQAISSNDMDLRAKVGPLRMRMKNGLLMSLGVDRHWPDSWVFWTVLAMQLLLISIMYRLTIARARDLFLTTYYDPFYPDLHLYTSRPDTHRLCMHSSSGPTWFSIPDTLRRDGWKASSRQIWHNLSIIIWHWQQLLWETLGDGTTSSTWPPT